MPTDHAEFEGMRIAYTVVGREHAAPGVSPVVFLHNAGASRHLWAEQLEHVGQTRPAYALDLFGYGDSDVPASGYGVQRYCDMLAAFLTAEGLTAPLLVGNCLGSAIIATLLRTDNRAVGAVLINPLSEQTARHGGYGRLIGPAARIPRGVLDWIRRRGIPRTAARRVVAEWFSTPPRIEELRAAELLVDELVKPGRLAALGETLRDLNTLARLDTDPLPPGAPPVCTIWGEENAILSSTAGRVLNATLAPVREEWLAGCGHAAMLEQPQPVCAIIDDFLDHDLAGCGDRCREAR